MTNNARNSATMTSQAKSGVVIFGDLAQNDSRISSLTYDDVVPNTGGKTLKEMAYDDEINTTQITNSAKNVA